LLRPSASVKSNAAGMPGRAGRKRQSIISGRRGEPDIREMQSRGRGQSASTSAGGATAMQLPRHGRGSYFGVCDEGRPAMTTGPGLGARTEIVGSRRRQCGSHPQHSRQAFFPNGTTNMSGGHYSNSEFRGHPIGRTNTVFDSILFKTQAKRTALQIK